MPEPVREFLEVSLASREEAGQFALQVLNLATSHRGIQMAAGSQRPVVFQPTMPEKKQSKAYVSPGAARLLAEVGAKYHISSTPVSLSDLPDGLALVIGDARDVAEYDARKRI